jgi:hypothetical protein
MMKRVGPDVQLQGEVKVVKKTNTATPLALQNDQEGSESESEESSSS